MALNTVTVTWDENDPTLSEVGGTITFTLSTTLTDTTDGKLVRPVAKSYPLSLKTSQPLVANDNSVALPTGSFYTITIQSADGSSYVFQALLNFANGATQGLASLVPLTTQPTMVSSLPLPSGTPVAGQVPVATGTGSASAWSWQLASSTAWLPSDNNLLIANLDPSGVSPNGAAPAAGVLYLQKWNVRQSLTISKLWWLVGGAGAGGSTGSFVGLYSSAGSLMSGSGSADIGSAFTTTGPVSTSLGSAQSLSAGTFVWAGLLLNLASSLPFMPQAWGSNTALLNLGLTAATAQFAKTGSGLTSLPASFTPSALTVPGIAWFVGGQ